MFTFTVLSVGGKLSVLRDPLNKGSLAILIMKQLSVDARTYAALEARAKELGMSVTDYISSLVLLIRKDGN